MSMDMFIDMGSKIKGESKDAAHADQIDVLSWNWGLSNSGSFHTGGGGGAGKVNIQDLTFQKWVDDATHNLMLWCCNGDHIDEVKLTVRKAGKDPLEYVVILLKKVLVTSISSGGSGGEERLTESVSLNFAHCTLDYVKQKDDGTGEAAKNFKWDIEANKSQ